MNYVKYCFQLTISLLCIAHSYGQKPGINEQAYDIWPSVDVPALSNDGRYAIYSVGQDTGGSYSMVIKSISDGWEEKIVGVSGSTANITADSRFVFFFRYGDSLGIFNLIKRQITYITNIASYKTRKFGNQIWAAYLSSVPRGNLKLCNLQTGKQMLYQSVTNFWWSDNGRTLLLLEHIEKDSLHSYSLQCINMEDCTTRQIWTGSKVSNVAFDTSGKKLTYIEADDYQNSRNKIWTYEEGIKNAKQLVDSSNYGMAHLMIADNMLHFSEDGNQIFFWVMDIPHQGKVSYELNSSSVDVWSYNDDILESDQLIKIRDNRRTNFWAVVGYKSDTVIKLNREGEEVASDLENYSGEYVLVKNEYNGHETFWEYSARPSFYLVSIKNESRKCVMNHGSYGSYVEVSPHGRYAIYYDPMQKNYFSYRISDGRTLNITNLIPFPVYDDELDQPGPVFQFGTAGWLPGDSALLIYDHYDVWQVDPSGKMPPICITNLYGRKSKIIFRKMDLRRSKVIYPDGLKKELILSAFDTVKKNNGFYKINFERNENPELLFMGPCVFDMPYRSYSTAYSSQFVFENVKATDTSMYLVKRMSTSEAPNYFVTHDFKTYSPLSHVAPQNRYNWMTTELVNWKVPGAKLGTGILYKPENFDTTRKYPVIFYVYDKFSDGLNQFLKPDWSNGVMDIPTYVSNGYLVFLPDINYTIGHPGQSVVNYVLSAAKYLSKEPWIDSTKIGLQGHSFGGYEVNYLLTHTHIFAAAVSAEGVSDLISVYGTDKYHPEIGQDRIGGTLWESQELYIENSPIFSANQVTTPVLFMDNKNDDQVPFSQGLELFTALRRLGKKAWLVQYDNEDHQVGGEASKDFTIRMRQFFDTYLMGNRAPEWMIKGVPAKLKGFYSGTEY